MNPAEDSKAQPQKTEMLNIDLGTSKPFGQKPNLTQKRPLKEKIQKDQEHESNQKGQYLEKSKTQMPRIQEDHNKDYQSNKKDENDEELKRKLTNFGRQDKTKTPERSKSPNVKNILSNLVGDNDKMNKIKETIQEINRSRSPLKKSNLKESDLHGNKQKEEDKIKQSLKIDILDESQQQNKKIISQIEQTQTENKKDKNLDEIEENSNKDDDSKLQKKRESGRLDGEKQRLRLIEEELNQITQIKKNIDEKESKSLIRKEFATQRASKEREKSDENIENEERIQDEKLVQGEQIDSISLPKRSLLKSKNDLGLIEIDKEEKILKTREQRKKELLTIQNEKEDLLQKNLESPVIELNLQGEEKQNSRIGHSFLNKKPEKSMIKESEGLLEIPTQIKNSAIPLNERIKKTENIIEDHTEKIELKQNLNDDLNKNNLEENSNLEKQKVIQNINLKDPNLNQNKLKDDESLNDNLLIQSVNNKLLGKKPNLISRVKEKKEGNPLDEEIVVEKKPNKMPAKFQKKNDIVEQIQDKKEDQLNQKSEDNQGSVKKQKFDDEKNNNEENLSQKKSNLNLTENKSKGENLNLNINEKSINSKKTQIEDERPLGIGKKIDQEDERPIGGGKKTQIEDERPLGGGKKTQIENEKPLGISKRINLEDEKSQGGKKKKQIEDERPIEGVKKTQMEDERPLGGGKKTQMEDERPLGGNKKAQMEDERPLGGNKKTQMEDERPLGGNKKTQMEDERPLGGSKKTQMEDERPLGGNKKTQMEDERPLGGVKKIDIVDEQPPVPKKTNPIESKLKPKSTREDSEKPKEPKIEKNSDEQPIGGVNKKIDMDEQPIGGGNKKINMDEQPIGGGNKKMEMDEQPIGGGIKKQQLDEFPPDGPQNETEEETTLEQKLKSSKFQSRIAAFEELCNWSDPSISPDIFSKSLHLTVKEKHPQVIDKMLTTFESLIQKHPSAFAAVDFKKFLYNFVEHLMNNVKAQSKDHSITFIPILYNASPNKDQFVEQLNAIIVDMKMKVQEKGLVFLLELIKDGKVEELKYLKAFWPNLEKGLISRTQGIRTTVLDIYKETFLWMGDAIKSFLTGLKKPQMDELDAYFASVDKSAMKNIKKGDGKVEKALDAYDLINEAELPKKYNEDQWADDVQRLEKWKEKKEELDKLNEILAKTPKISPKTNTMIFVPLAKKLLADSNMAVAATMLKTLGYLAAGLRKHFLNAAKVLYGTLIGKLKEKNRQVNEEVLNTLEKFYLVLNFDDTIEELKENLKEKNADKKLNILKLLKVLLEKGDKIKNEKSGVSLTKMVLPLLDENDEKVRELASEVIGKCLDAFNDKISPLLNDLNSQKKSKIMKYSTGPKQAETAKETKSENKETNENKDEKKETKIKKGGGLAKDKSQMIADIRESLFSNKSVKISDTKNFSKFVESNLKDLLTTTKDFKEVTATQAKEIFLLIEEICLKVEKAAFIEDSRKIIVSFFVEQFGSKNSEELQECFDKFVYKCPNKLISGKLFLNDAFDIISKKSIKVSRELLVSILKIVERECVGVTSLSTVPLKPTCEFLKTNCGGATLHSSFKMPIISLMKLLVKQFGDKAIADFPANMIKDYESANQENTKMFEKTMEKLSDKNPEKKKQVLVEIATCSDPSKVVQYFNSSDFISFLKRSLITETNKPLYKQLLSVVENYLETKSVMPGEFSIKNFLYVFQTVLTHYYDHRDSENPRSAENVTALESFFQKTVTALTPTVIFNEMVSDPNALSWKEQIFHFFLQFSSQVNPDIKFVNFIANVLTLKNLPSEVKSLAENVLLTLKNVENDELIIKGNDNKTIREIWMKNEEDVLFDLNFVKGLKPFEEPSMWGPAKGHLQKVLGIEDSHFASKSLDAFQIDDNDLQLKTKLVYLYFRSVENLPLLAESIMKLVYPFVAVAFPDKVVNLLVFKILFNLTKNHIFAFADSFFQELRKNLMMAYHIIEMPFEELCLRIGANEPEIHALEGLLQSHFEFGFVAVGDNQSQPNFAQDQQPVRERMPSRGKKRGSQVSLGHAEDNYYQNQNHNNSPRSQISYKSGKRPISSNFERRSPETAEHLQMLFDKMLTFDMSNFEEASFYFNELAKQQRGSTASNFLIANAGPITATFVEVFDTVFLDGINFELEKESYDLIFLPFQNLSSIEGFLSNLDQQVVNGLIQQLHVRMIKTNDEKTNLEKNKTNPELIELANYVIKFFNLMLLRVLEFGEPNSYLNSILFIIHSSIENPNEPLSASFRRVACNCIKNLVRRFKKNIERIDPASLMFMFKNYGLDNDYAGSRQPLQLLGEVIAINEPKIIWDCYDQVFRDRPSEAISALIEEVQANGIKADYQSVSNYGSVKNNQTYGARKNNTSYNLSGAETDLRNLINELNNNPNKALLYIGEIKKIMETNPNLDIQTYEKSFKNKVIFEQIKNDIRRGFNLTQNFNQTASKSNIQNPPKTKRKEDNKSEIYDQSEQSRKMKK